MGASIKSKAIYTGRNYDVGPWVDTHFIRCSRCGWINNLDREIHSNDGGYEGWGTTFVAQSANATGSGAGDLTYQIPAYGDVYDENGNIVYDDSGNPVQVLTEGYSLETYPLVDPGLQTADPGGIVMYSTSNNSTDILSNIYGAFSFGTIRAFGGNQLLLNGVWTSHYGVMLLLYGAQIYHITNASNWFQYTGSAWVSIIGDPRGLDVGLQGTWDSGTSWDSAQTWDAPIPFISTTMDAVVGAGCSQCGTLLYTR